MKISIQVLLSLLFIIFIFAACNNEDEKTPFDKVLNQAPYASLTDSIKNEKSNADLYYHRAQLLKKNDLPEAALADYKKAWSLNKKEEYAVGLSSLLLDKNPDSAVVFLQSALQIIPSLFLQLNLAEAYTQQKNASAALSVYDQILQKEPNQIDALMKKSVLLDQQNKPDESLSVMEKAYQLAPFDVELSYDLAYKYAENNNPKAIALSDSLIKMDSIGRHAEPYYFKGVYFSNTGNKSKAIQQFNLAIQHDYNFLDAHMEKGVIYYDQKNFAEALKSFQLVTTISPSYANAYYWIAKVQEAEGKKQEAKLNYQRAYGLDKTLSQAKQAAENIK